MWVLKFFQKIYIKIVNTLFKKIILPLFLDLKIKLISTYTWIYKYVRFEFWYQLKKKFNRRYYLPVYFYFLKKKFKKNLTTPPHYLISKKNMYYDSIKKPIPLNEILTDFNNKYKILSIVEAIELYKQIVRPFYCELDEGNLFEYEIEIKIHEIRKQMINWRIYDINHQLCFKSRVNKRLYYLFKKNITIYYDTDNQLKLFNRYEPNWKAAQTKPTFSEFNFKYRFNLANETWWRIYIIEGAIRFRYKRLYFYEKPLYLIEKRYVDVYNKIIDIKNKPIQTNNLDISQWPTIKYSNGKIQRKKRRKRNQSRIKIPLIFQFCYLLVKTIGFIFAVMLNIMLYAMAIDIVIYKWTYEPLTCPNYINITPVYYLE